jgi:hypothetical protein|tara:strand:- start:554 stop:1018 length:465 start_codon:yes stop_codon:yes gene_type:complete
MKKNSFIIIILSIFIFTKANAELIKPSSNIEPYKVVKIQLSSLMKNNYPNKDSGIEQTWEFAHPNNQKYTGPLEKFKIMLKGESYKMLLNHLDHKIVAVQVGNGFADYEVTVLDVEKKYYKFNWRVEKYQLDGNLKNCWLTTMVSQPIPLGSSI